MKGQIVTAKCIDLSFEGKGVAKFGKGIVFVDGLFPGEEAEVEITYVRAGSYFGKIKKLLTQSKDRIQPRCPVCTSCGGCQFQQLNYQTQLAFKKSKVKKAFLRAAKIDVEVNDVIGMENPYFYRNKIQMPVAKDKSGKIITGFYKANSHVIVPIEKCYIEDERSSPILQTIRELMKEIRVDPYDEDKRTGVIRHILIRTSYYKKQIMVVLVTNVNSFPGQRNFVVALTAKHPEITTIVQNINKRDTNVILGNYENILYGKGFIEDSLLGINYQVSSKSFYQINPKQTEKLYSAAIKVADMSKDDIVLDAYTGIGTIAILAAKHAKHVIGVEIINQAVRDAMRNAKHNGIENVEFHSADVSDYIAQLADNKQQIDVLFMDPPRKGAEESFIRSVLKLKPKKIIYISCEPETLARDIKLLASHYEIKSVQPVDMFPQTHHVETITLLSLKTA
ncbi:MAG: 23S rRNA (uracil(1939)-C(5))-methyltransferase RlmD [Bacilli bacterium]